MKPRSPRPGEVFVGDWLRAVQVLKLDDSRRRRMAAEILGLLPVIRSPEPPSEPGPQRAPDASPRKRRTRPSAIPPELLSDPAPEAVARPEPPEIGRLIETTAFPVPGTISGGEQPPGWLRELPPLPAAGETERLPGLELEPLLLPRWTRSVLSAALATLQEDGDPDVERLSEELARQRPLPALPREPWPSLARGVQVLVDKSAAMEPFGADQARLARALRRLASESGCRVLRFAGCPRREPERGGPRREAGAGSRESWRAYAPPPPGTPVVLLTDLGIGRPPQAGERASETEWIAFLRFLRKARCPAVALVPYPPARWPARLRRHVAIVPWDRSTSVATVRRVVGRAHEVEA